MQNSKLFLLLRSLQPEEIHWFQKFVKSPFYNNNTLPIQLFDYIKKYYPDLDSPKLSKEATCKKLFPKDKSNIQKLRKTMHGLALLVEDFLVAMQLRKNEYQKKKLLVTELRDRNVYTLFEKGAKELIGGLEELPYRDAHFYKEVHDLNLGYFGHMETGKEKGGRLILKSVVEHLDYYYLIQRQRLDFSIKEHERLFKSKLKIGSLNQAKTLLLEESTYKLYKLISEMISTSWNENNYLNIESLFKSEIGSLGKNDKLEIFRILLNQLSGQVNKGKEGYHSKMLSMYKFGLEHNLVLMQGQINDTTFANIASVGIVSKEFDWVEQFIEKYKYFLPKKVVKDATYFSLSLLYFHRQEFEKTIDTILNHTFSNPLYILHSKAILLRTYFEQFLLDNSYYQLVLDQTYAFEKFVRRNELISASKKELYINFILFTRKIINDVLQNSLSITLYDTIKNTKSVMLKSWLLDKVNDKLKR